jgi:hypothetical protein
VDVPRTHGRQKGFTNAPLPATSQTATRTHCHPFALTRYSKEQRVTKRYTENAEAYQLYLKGRCYWHRRSVDGRALALNRSAILNHSQYPFYLTVAGRTDEAIAVARRAFEQDPVSASLSHTLAV